ncbi:unnamed protein product [Nippostrongylus brasiliensis]|uniref:Lysozyme n=1 Tax=Nippostrongylus brasiliensis TaxID=27835 RepID=A0A0N4Y229_NIPBR|nr:unnamed protein product [Nippostrongylus brasiliensis]
MTPNPTSSKTGATQFDELYTALINANINVRSIWLQQYGLTVGIYTNSYDWDQIAGGATVYNVMLWYWKVNGAGTSGETPANYNDFRSFGGWSKPSVKQFAQSEYTCGVLSNRDIYTTSTSVDSSDKVVPGKVVVGGLRLNSVTPGAKAEVRE